MGTKEGHRHGWVQDPVRLQVSVSYSGLFKCEKHWKTQEALMTFMLFSKGQVFLSLMMPLG